MNSNENQQSRIRVWDWTIRVFHWGLVFLILCMWSTAENHGIWKQVDNLAVEWGILSYARGNMYWHTVIAAGVMFLMSYRIYWGIVGSSTARFGAFVKGPAAISAYIKSLKNKPYKPGVGHNPLGALSVIALLLVLMAQLGTGLFSVDTDGLASGPLSGLVDYDTGRFFVSLHETAFRALYILITLHVVAVLVYQFVLKAGLLKPMLAGSRPSDKTKITDESDQAEVSAPLLKVAFGVVLSAGLVWLVWTV